MTTSITDVEGEFSTWIGKARVVTLPHIGTWVSSSEDEDLASLPAVLGVGMHHRVLPVKCGRGDTYHFHVAMYISWCMTPMPFFSCLIVKQVEFSQR